MDLLVNEAAARVSDPTFAVESDTIANRLAIPLPAAVMFPQTATAVMRRCAKLVAADRRREAAALLAGYLLAAVRWSWPLTPCRTVLDILADRPAPSAHSCTREESPVPGKCESATPSSQEPTVIRASARAPGSSGGVRILRCVLPAFERELVIDTFEARPRPTAPQRQ